MMNSISTTVETRAARAGENLYDLSMVDDISGGDKSFTRRMLQLFLDTVPATLADIKSASDKSEWLALSKHAHKLKSTIDSLNINSLKQDIRSIESFAKSGGDANELKRLTARLLTVMNDVMHQVKVDLS